jgi:putative hemolysin
MIRQGADLGVFEESEQEMVERVFRLGDRSVKSLMTHRTDIVWVDLASPITETLQEVIESGYSRFPVGRGSLEQCLGIIRGSSLLAARLNESDINLETLIQPPLYIAENTRALNVLEQFKQARIHTALVIDEYGGVEGLVTLNDIVEAIFGELPSVEDTDAPMIVQREDGSWLLDGLLAIDEFQNLFSDLNLPQMSSQEYHTLGGFIMSSLKHIPQASEYFEWGGLRLEVMDMDGTRVDKVLVTLVSPDFVKEDQENDQFD